MTDDTVVFLARAKLFVITFRHGEEIDSPLLSVRDEQTVPMEIVFVREAILSLVRRLSGPRSQRKQSREVGVRAGFYSLVSHGLY